MNPARALSFAAPFLLLSVSTIVACSRGDVPECRSSETAGALLSYLSDPAVRAPERRGELEPILAQAHFKISNIEETTVEPGMKRATCHGTVHIEVRDRVSAQDLVFSDHFTGDHLHVIEADTSAVDARVLDVRPK